MDNRLLATTSDAFVSPLSRSLRHTHTHTFNHVHLAWYASPYLAHGDRNEVHSIDQSWPCNWEDNKWVTSLPSASYLCRNESTWRLLREAADLLLEVWDQVWLSATCVPTRMCFGSHLNHNNYWLPQCCVTMATFPSTHQCFLWELI